MSEKNRDHMYDGWFYHLTVDPAMRRVRRLVRAEVQPGASLIDIGSGTGELVLSLRDRCSCLVGVETSRRMWAYANQRSGVSRRERVRFLQGDGRVLEDFATGSFDYATACMVFHEMDEGERLPMLREMQRVAQTLILVDYLPVQRMTLEFGVCMLIERLAGLRHYANFTTFVTAGGLRSLTESLALAVHREIRFYRECFHLIGAQ